MENKLAKIEEQLLLSISKGGDEAIESAKQLVELKTKQLVEEVSYNKEVIESMTDCIRLNTQKSYIKDLVMVDKDKWDLLCKAYEEEKNIILNARVEGHERVNFTSIDKLDYIEKIGDLPLLCSIAVKLF